MTDIHKRAEEIAAAMGGPDERANITGTVFLSNLRHELLAVARCAKRFADEDCLGDTFMDALANLGRAVAAYEAALKRELWGEP